MVFSPSSRVKLGRDQEERCTECCVKVVVVEVPDGLVSLVDGALHHSGAAVGAAHTVQQTFE